MPASLAANGVIALMVLGWLLLMANRAVSVEVNPHIAFAPASIQVTVRVQPDAENRNLIVEAVGGDYRRSDVQLDGDVAPIQHLINWRGLDGGEYEVIASVTSNTALLARERTHMRVIGRGE